MIKIQIKNRWTGSIIFEYSKENATIKDAVKEYIRLEIEEKGKTRANLTNANLTDANLTRANLTDADLTIFKYDLWAKLLIQKSEVEGLKQKLIEGKIDGSCYEGECCCFVGTLANVKQVRYTELDVKADSTTPIERWFMQLSPGMTPDKSKVAKITLE